ncbi:MAG: KEOPS complex subunit Pcc1 [Fervidobacterium sp.]
MIAELRINLANPEYVRKSLLPDIDNSKGIKVDIKSEDKVLVVKIQAEKISHLKATLNSYLSLINVIKEME